MKAEDLLLTHEEYRDAIIQGGKITTGVRDYNVAATLSRAQVAKVLAVLGRYAMIDSKVTGLSHPACNTISAEEIQRIAQEAGLTWPVGALGDESGCPECGSAAKYYSMPHIHVSIPPKEG